MSQKLRKWGPAALCAAVTLTFSLIFYYRAPYHDHWDIVPYFASFKEGSLAFSDLFALHGNHWHASGYLVQLSLAEVTAMGHWAESLASVVFAGLGFIAIARIIDSSVEHFDARSATVWAYGLSGFLLFSLDQAANWLWGWQVAVFINIAAALWVIERLTFGAPSLSRTLQAAMAAAIAIYAFGTGWALIPVGFALLLLYGGLGSWAGRVSLVIWAGLTALLIWHFSLAVTDSAAAYTTQFTPNFTDPETLIGLLHYAINFVASPIVRFARDSSLVAVAIGLCIIIWSVWSLREQAPKRVWQGAAPFLAMAAYSFGSGLLTALGRWEAFGVKHAFVSRYISFGTFFWIAVFALAIFAIAKTRQTTHRAIFSALGLLFVMKLGNIPSVVQKSIEISHEVRLASVQVAEDYPDLDPRTYAVLHNSVQKIEPHLEILRDDKVSLFAQIDDLKPPDANLEDTE